MTVLRPLIENFTTDEEAQELACLAAQNPLVLEVGTFKGFGAVLMARAGAHVWAVDWHRGDQDLGDRDTLVHWWTNVRRHGVVDQVVGLVGRTSDVLPLLRREAFWMAFIDGYHALEAVRLDIELTLPLMRPGGLLVFHDYDRKVWPGVVQAVDELREQLLREGRLARQDGRKMRIVGSLAALRLV